jgi:hypothetical protein
MANGFELSGAAELLPLSMGLQVASAPASCQASRILDAFDARGDRRHVASDRDELGWAHNQDLPPPLRREQ